MIEFVYTQMNRGVALFREYANVQSSSLFSLVECYLLSLKR